MRAGARSRPAKERAEAEALERARLEALRPRSAEPEPEPTRKSRPPRAEPPAEKIEPEAPRKPAAESQGARAGREDQGRRGAARVEQIAKRERAGHSRSSPRPRTIARQEEGRQAAKSPVKAGDERRERIKLTINNAFDEAQRERSLASLRRKREREKLRQAGVVQPRDKVMREVIIPEVITIQELANRMTERSVDVIKLLMGQGAMHKINDVIDADTAELIVREFGHTPKRVSEADVEEGFIGQTDDEENQQPRRARRHHHGPRRPRQDLAARRHPPHQRCGRRGRRHHAAHRRLSGGDAQRPEDHVHRYAGPRGVHRHARSAAPRSPTSSCWWSPPTTA